MPPNRVKEGNHSRETLGKVVEDGERHQQSRNSSLTQGHIASYQNACSRSGNGIHTIPVAVPAAGIDGDQVEATNIAGYTRRCYLPSGRLAMSGSVNGISMARKLSMLELLFPHGISGTTYLSGLPARGYTFKVDWIDGCLLRIARLCIACSLTACRSSTHRWKHNVIYGVE